jgi:phosphoribosyl 1,2-cyclic phosphodiesterase
MRISFASGLSHYGPLPPGQPFCPSIDHPDASVTLHVPVDSSHSDPVEALAAIEHKGGTTYWARLTLNDATLAYLPDPTVTDAPTERCESAESLAVGIDVLLHDGQFLATEIDMATGYGHATIDAAMDFADRCGVGELVLTHHAPARTDAQLAALAAAFTRTPQGRRVRFARQDQTIPVARAAIQTAPKHVSPVAEIQRTP